MSRNAQQQNRSGNVSSAKRDTRVAPEAGTPAHSIRDVQSSRGNQAAQQLFQSSDIDEALLEELALDPGRAHEELRRLKLEKPWQWFAAAIQIAAKMQLRFDPTFAGHFLTAVRAGTGRDVTIYWQPRSGPHPTQLLTLGYRRRGMEIGGPADKDVDLWVHWDGRRIRRDLRQLSEATDVQVPAEGRDDDGGGRKPFVLEGTPIEQWKPQLTDHEWERLRYESDVYNSIRTMQEYNTELAEFCNRDPFPELDQRSFVEASDSKFNLQYDYLKFVLRKADMKKLGLAASDRFKREFAAMMRTHGELVYQCEAKFDRLEDGE